jgi:hypothetical protein
MKRIVTAVLALVVVGGLSMGQAKASGFCRPARATLTAVRYGGARFGCGSWYRPVPSCWHHYRPHCR